MGCLLLGQSLAREIELAEAQAAVACVEKLKELKPEASGAVEPIAGGYAIYCGANSPVTQAVGLGLSGYVSAEEFDRLERFYFSREEPVRVETCPLADPSLFEQYNQRGYRVTEFSNVMARDVIKQRSIKANGIEVRRASRDELELWTLTVAQGFSENLPVNQEILDVMSMFAMAKDTECYLARIEGRVVGGATLALRGKIAGLFGASTLPEFRKRGVQTALLRARLERAEQVGCELAVSLALPGSISQRNITRQGFQTLYTRVKFERACPTAAHPS
jgi:GNAT superfamily N-acetyltransferase